MNLYHDTLSTPVGNLLIRATEEGISEVSMGENIHYLSPKSNEIIIKAKCQLDEYFKGLRDDFDLPLDISSHSAFYQKVWQTLLTVPYGKTSNYSEIAMNLGDIKAVRAVGAANGKNPIAIIIPCHRIIGKSGKLVGYAWGVEVKRWLLEHELAHSPVPEHMLF